MRVRSLAGEWIEMTERPSNPGATYRRSQVAEPVRGNADDWGRKRGQRVMGQSAFG